MYNVLFLELTAFSCNFIIFFSQNLPDKKMNKGGRIMHAFMGNTCIEDSQGDQALIQGEHTCPGIFTVHTEAAQ